MGVQGGHSWVPVLPVARASVKPGPPLSKVFLLQSLLTKECHLML